MEVYYELWQNKVNDDDDFTVQTKKSITNLHSTSVFEDPSCFTARERFTL